MRNFFIQFIGFGATFLMLFVMLDAAKLFSGNLKFTDVETEVSFWGRSNYQPDRETIERTERSIEALVEASGHNPSYRNLSASASVWFAYWAIDAAARERFAQKAVTTQFEAIKSRPAHRHSWIKLIEYLSKTNKSGETEAMAKEQLAGLQRYTKTI